MPPVDPLNGGFSLSPLLWRRTCPERTIGGLGRTSDDFRLIFGIPSWLMPLRDRSGQRWQPSGEPYVVAATEVCSRFIGTCPTLRCTHIVHTLTRQVFLGCCNEVWAHRFPFHPFPFAHIFSSFFSCLPLLHVLSSDSFRSFTRTTVRALVCTRTSTAKSGFRSPRFQQ